MSLFNEYEESTIFNTLLLIDSILLCSKGRIDKLMTLDANDTFTPYVCICICFSVLLDDWCFAITVDNI